MARMLIDCMVSAGYQVEVASQLRVFFRESENESYKTEILQQARVEVERLGEIWSTNGAPDLWFCYHPYFKSPDLIGPELCGAFEIPYFSAEASYSARRNKGVWRDMQARVLASVERAAVNICFTARDMSGLRAASPTVYLERLQPFIDADTGGELPRQLTPCQLVTAAMMRSGDKLESYARLAASLELLLHLPWNLSIIGHGPMHDTVVELFKRIPSERLSWHGQQDSDGVAALFRQSSLYLWPGCGEAYGLAYLEAQAAGLPVVAYDTAGVPEVVASGVGGVLTPLNDDVAYAKAIEDLIIDEQKYTRLSLGARACVRERHSLDQASRRLKSIIQRYVG
ncbi:MAG: glycosyltransferase family 4 protein [Granulosicoccus sp.]